MARTLDSIINATQNLYEVQLPFEAARYEVSAHWRDGVPALALGNGPVSKEKVTLGDLRKLVGGRLNNLYDGSFVRTGGGSNQHTFAELVNPAAKANDFDSWWLRDPRGGNHRVTAYNRTSGTLTTIPRTTVAGTAAQPGVNELMEFWRPFGRSSTARPPSERVEESIRRARQVLVYRGQTFLVTEARRGDYQLNIDDEGLVSVEIQRMEGEYFRGWAKAGYMDFRAGELTLLRSKRGDPYEAGDIVRVGFREVPPVLERDADFWYVDREWASVEATMQMINDLSLVDLKDLGINLTSRAALQSEQRILRRRFLPSSREIVTVPR